MIYIRVITGRREIIDVGVGVGIGTGVICDIVEIESVIRWSDSWNFADTRNIGIIYIDIGSIAIDVSAIDVEVGGIGVDVGYIGAVQIFLFFALWPK